MDIDTLIRLAGVLGVSTARVKDAFTAADVDARRRALESVSDSVPGEAYVLALLAEVATGERVTAIKNAAPRSVLDPSAFLVTWERPRGWVHPRVTAPGYVLIVAGNPVRVESWCRRSGHLAFAGDPHACWVSAERRDEWREDDAAD